MSAGTAARRQRRRHCLAALGVTVWRPRSGGVLAPATAVPASPEPAALDWDALREAVHACRRCALHRERRQAVFGAGGPGAAWMFVGEAPGAEEDARGEPFVGRAGKLLNAMLAAIGLRREEVCIANVLKCRPPRNRDPLPEEQDHCRPWLERQLELVAPQVVVALGRFAAQNLLATDAPLARLRGTVHRLPGVGTPVVVTYHPAYLLRSPQHKGRAWEDLLLARAQLAGGGS